MKRAEMDWVASHEVFAADTDSRGPLPTLDLVVTVEGTPGSKVGTLAIASAARAARFDDLVGWLQGGIHIRFRLGLGGGQDGRSTTLRDHISAVVADERGVVLDLKTTLDGEQEFPDNFAARWDLNLHALVVLPVDDGVRSAALQIDVFEDFPGETVAFLAEGDVLAVGFIWGRAASAVVCVTGVGAHDEELVIPGSPGEEGLWVEVDLPDDGRHGGR